ncbi:MAG TPA: hypothetical protein VIV60_36640 [Polyangiaceae bacterium]
MSLDGGNHGFDSSEEWSHEPGSCDVVRRLVPRVKRTEERAATIDASYDEVKTELRELRVAVGSIYRVVVERVDPALAIVQKQSQPPDSDPPDSEEEIKTGMIALPARRKVESARAERDLAKLKARVAAITAGIVVGAAAAVECVRLLWPMVKGH